MAHVGNITIPADVDVWPHELRTAKALARAGQLRNLRRLVFVNRRGQVFDIK